MIEIAAPSFNPDREIIIPCECAGACELLVVGEWDDGEGNENWQSFDFYTSYRTDKWRFRIKAAWESLRGKKPYYHAIVISPEQGDKLAKWLSDKIKS